ncbi:hypothetical protein TELCIR_08624 [Teladorsagia circumcincta]|uniref:Uncharacterized protein n=1 Tax=Teladorsagia circumcincta TaxID=45464 RepID=A0A2G9UH92_TELCI|nr:hypothetical protein TELCIR_08624 [Teladorsagia circumcincta]
MRPGAHPIPSRLVEVIRATGAISNDCRGFIRDVTPDQDRHPVDSILSPGAEVGHVTGIAAGRDHEQGAGAATSIATGLNLADLARGPCRRVAVVVGPLLLVAVVVGVEAVAVVVLLVLVGLEAELVRPREELHSRKRATGDKESRREKGEAVSSDDGGDDRKGESTRESPATFKHPFGVRTAAPSDGIKINIVNATSIPTKTPQERVLDTSQLRLVYPVSSGVVHKENTEKWTPVVKDELKTCSDEQKKYVAVTSLEAERYRAATGSSNEHLLPPPPPPPVLTGLGGLLPPPPPPPKLTAFDMLLPPPPPLPQLLVVPPEDKLIIKEPENVDKVGEVEGALAKLMF